MARALVVILMGLIALCLMGADRTGIPYPDHSYVELPETHGMTTCPEGDGPTFEYIHVFAIDINGNPSVRCQH